ncbi:MAG: helix-turn-helix domain-containing protein [Acidimicrobiales bacterium]
MNDSDLIDSDLIDRIRQLRGEGLSPKEIARSLGMRPAVVAPIVRRLAVDKAGDAAEAALVGCWVNQGWSEELGVAGHPEWPRGAPSQACKGLATVLVAREARGGKVSVCTVLVDTHCLGVKDTLGPRVMGRDKLVEFKRAVYGGYDVAPIAVPLELAQHLVFGAVEYARALGFEPASDFERCAAHLGSWSGPSAIRFGRYGKAMYVAGPHDDASRVMRTLERSLGQGNFDFLIGVPV